MAWIAQVPPSPRHPKPRWQVRYQDGPHQRSAGIYPTPQAAEKARTRIERGLPPMTEVTALDGVDLAKARTLFGDYVTKVWWPTWRGQHPDSAGQIGKRIEKRILPAFGNTPLADLDADRIGAWKATLMTDGLKPAGATGADDRGLQPPGSRQPRHHHDGLRARGQTSRAWPAHGPRTRARPKAGRRTAPRRRS